MRQSVNVAAIAILRFRFAATGAWHTLNKSQLQSNKTMSLHRKLRSVLSTHLSSCVYSVPLSALWVSVRFLCRSYFDLFLIMNLWGVSYSKWRLPRKSTQLSSIGLELFNSAAVPRRTVRTGISRGTQQVHPIRVKPPLPSGRPSDRLALHCSGGRNSTFAHSERKAAAAESFAMCNVVSVCVRAMILARTLRKRVHLHRTKSR